MIELVNLEKCFETRAGRSCVLRQVEPARRLDAGGEPRRAALHRGYRSRQRDALAASTLDRFQIAGKKDLYPNQLSGGQGSLHKRERLLHRLGGGAGALLVVHLIEALVERLGTDRAVVANLDQRR